MCFPRLSSSVRQWEKCLPDSWCRLVVCLATKQLLYRSTTTRHTGTSQPYHMCKFSCALSVGLEIEYRDQRSVNGYRYRDFSVKTGEQRSVQNWTQVSTVLDNPLKWAHTVRCRLYFVAWESHRKLGVTRICNFKPFAVYISRQKSKIHTRELFSVRVTLQKKVCGYSRGERPASNTRQ